MIDIARLGPWMDRAGLAGKGEPIECRAISGGAQNEIYEVSRGDLRAALRIPPERAPEARDKGIVREWRIIEALDGTDVPHVAAIALCEDTSVLGRAFYLMGFVDGWSPMGLRDRAWPQPFAGDVEAKRGLAYQLAESIALLSKVDWRARGLGDLGRPDGFHERQVARWTSFYEKAGGRRLDGYDEARAWLSEHRPLDYVPGIMHGDYQFANVMYHHGAPARLAAIVDWEMGTIGDPKLDLAWMLQNWPEDTSPPSAATATYVDLRHMPTPAQLLARYSEVSGRQVDDIDYYTVLASWKLGVVLEQGFQRAGDNPRLQAFGPLVPALFEQAAELAESTDYRR
ncbi:acyl-CoA dehydrogenase [Actinomadura craniellae]|uniref:Acyl-CoA dehydrogenase n=1 Tax=Actinomadura craniellae TaxID=2231787 RepID=A0A365H6Q5_9ACTN|nr:phosphotransferase family protein [Actinomadura craniellae]RAY14656.1 acyl-CoA dehydrogenase [Actinomadura craniellae]